MVTVVVALMTSSPFAPRFQFQSFPWDILPSDLRSTLSSSFTYQGVRAVDAIAADHAVVSIHDQRPAYQTSPSIADTNLWTVDPST
nr:hypothetical protein CFP56_01300 [Quercus suber]